MQACAIIGAGPAGTGVLRQLAAAGVRDVAILDPRPIACAGTLGDHVIGSDTRASKLLSLLPDVPDLARARRHLARHGDGPAPLRVAGEALRDLGTWCVDSSGARFVRTRVTSLRRCGGGWDLTREDGARLRARSVILALGGAEVEQRGPALLCQYGVSRAVTPSGQVLSGKTRLSGRIAVLGGSHSAMAVAGLVLRGDPDARVTLIHRSPLHPTYADAAEATAAGAGFTAGDVCAATGRVFALGGFRLDAADLLRRHRSGREPRLSFLHAGEVASCRDALERADTVVGALGYAPRTVPVLESDGREIALGPRVDPASRVLCARGLPIPGLFRLGLAAGLDLAGRFGEPGFRGQANGLALWHREVGADIARQVGHRAAEPTGRRHDRTQHHTVHPA